MGLYPTSNYASQAANRFAYRPQDQWSLYCQDKPFYPALTANNAVSLAVLKDWHQRLSHLNVQWVMCLFKAGRMMVWMQSPCSTCNNLSVKLAHWAKANSCRLFLWLHQILEHQLYWILHMLIYWVRPQQLHWTPNGTSWLAIMIPHTTSTSTSLRTNPRLLLLLMNFRQWQRLKLAEKSSKSNEMEVGSSTAMPQFCSTSKRDLMQQG